MPRPVAPSTCGTNDPQPHSPKYRVSRAFGGVASSVRGNVDHPFHLVARAHAITLVLLKNKRRISKKGTTRKGRNDLGERIAGDAHYATASTRLP